MTEEPAGFPKPGDVFEERYRIDKLIGSGGFAKVYLATQMDLGREVALKIMLPEEVLADILGKNDSSNQGHKLAERFMQEARVVAKLRDPHTVTMHDHGKSKDDLLYMVFEYVDGVPLSRLVKAEGPLDPRRVAKILRQTLESLQEAHSMGMLHRDVKPGNIMVYEHVGRADQVKVLDFGIAKVVGQKVNQDLRGDLTTNGALLGTPRYMSPEQIRGQDLTPASDIYSLGLVAYEMLLGQKAIDSNSSVIVIGAQLDPRSFAVPNQPHIPPNLRAIVNRMLSKETKERYHAVEEVLDDLTRLDTGAFPAAELPPRQSGQYPVASVPDISDSIEPLAVVEAEDEWENSNPSPLGRNRLAVIAIAGACLLVGVLTAIMLSQSPGEDDDGSVSATERPTTEQGGAALAAMGDESPDDETDSPDPEEAAAEAQIDEIVIITTPPALKISVNGKPAGRSPVSLQTAEVTFPVTIQAEAGNGRDRLRILDAPVPRVEFDLSTLVAAKEQPPKADPDRGTTRKKVEKNEPRKVNRNVNRGNRGNQEPKSRNQDESRDDSKDEAKADSDEEKGSKFSLPALDTY